MMPRSEWDWRLLRNWRIFGSEFTVVKLPQNSKEFEDGSDAFVEFATKRICIPEKLTTESFEEFIDAIGHEIDHAIDDFIGLDNLANVVDAIRGLKNNKLNVDLEEFVHDIRSRCRRVVMSDNEGNYRYILSKLNKKL